MDGRRPASAAFRGSVRAENYEFAVAATTIGSNWNRLRLLGSIVACTQSVLAAPNVSTRVKLPSTFPLSSLSGWSTLK